MRHLVIGASGQVGEQLIKTVLDNNEEAIGTFYKTPLHGWNNTGAVSQKIPPGKNFTLDITRQDDVERLIADVIPDVIYITAANTRVDYCEQEPEQTRLTNVDGVANIVNAINSVKKNTSRSEPLVVFFSTDYLFSGKSGPYDENEIPSPICEYGHQKLLAEHYIATNVRHFIIARTTGVFSPETQEKNFVTRLVKNLRAGKEAIIPVDELGTPTYAPDLAVALMKIIKNLGSNYRTHTSHIINIAGPNPVTRFEFALDIAKIFECDPDLIKSVYSEVLERPAKRPLKGGLVTDKLEGIIGRKLMGHQEALKEMSKL